jgi:serine/threonine protein kinase
MGRAIVLLIPRPDIPLSYYGIPSWWRFDDYAYQVRYLLGGCHSLLHGRVRARHRSRPQTGFHPPVSSTGFYMDHLHYTYLEGGYSDIKPDNILIDKDGHIKLSDFGLSTGFHKQHDAHYYQRLLDSANGVQTPASARQQARNSVMVNAIHLTMSSKDQIATWKANRRKLVRGFWVPELAPPFTHISLSRHTRRLVRLTISLPRSSFSRGTVTNVTGGLWVRSCSSAWLDTRRSALNPHMRRTKRSSTGRIISPSLMMYT